MRPLIPKVAPLVLSIGLALTGSISGCDSTASLSATEHIERAKKFQSEGDLRAGILELKNAVQKDPENKQARWLLGMAYLDLRLGGDAEAQLTKSVQLGISPASARIPIARAQLLQADYQKILDTLLPGDNDDKGIQAQILDLRANALLGLKQFSEGCALFNRAIEIDDSYGPAHTGRARCQYGDGLTSAALTSAERATQLDPTHLESWYLLGDLRRALNQNDAAIAAYDQALKIKPNDYDAIAFKAMTLLSMDRMKDAEASIKRLNAMRPHAHPTKYLKAYVAYQQGRNSEATNLLQQILKDSPDNPQANMLFGTINYAINNNETALSSFNRVLSVAEQPEARLMLAATQVRMNANADADKTLAPLVAQGTNPKALLLAGQVALNLGNLDRGMALLARANALSPKDTVIRTSLARNQILSGNSQGIRGLESVITDKPDDTQAYLLLAATQFSQNDLAGARATLQKMATALPKNPTPDLLAAQQMLGGVEIQSGRYDDALVIARTIQQQQPDAAEGHLLEAQIHFARKAHDESLSSYERAFKVAPSGAILIQQLQVFGAMGKPEEGEKRIEAWLTRKPDDTSARGALAEGLLKRQQFSPAIDQYLLLNKRVPGNLVVLNNLTWALAENQDKRALAYADQVLKLAPDNPSVLDTYGWAQVRLGNLNKGLEFLKRAQAKTPDSADVQWHLAYALNASGDTARARQELKALLDRRVSFSAEAQAKALYQKLSSR